MAEKTHPHIAVLRRRTAHRLLRLRKEVRRLHQQVALGHIEYMNLRQVVDISPVPVAVFDRNLCYVLCSQSWIMKFHMDFPDVSGRVLPEVFPSLWQAWREDYRACLDGVPLREEIASIELANGRAERLRWTLLPWYGAGGVVQGVMQFAEPAVAGMEWGSLQSGGGCS